jgi:Fic family protein
MTNAPSGDLTERLRGLSTELRSLEHELKSGQTPEALLLQEFRHVLDNVRLTAWTVSELQNARERQQDPAIVVPFVVAERLRRANQMLKDLCDNIEHEGVTWQTGGIQSLFETVKQLQIQLIKLIDEHRARVQKTTEVGR